MALVRWEPTRELSALQNEMNRLFGSFFDVPTTPSGGAARGQWIPAIDLVETAGEYVLRADLPGLDADDVKIELDENVLTLSGERTTQHEQQADGYRRIERASGSFSRSLTLPAGVDPEHINASFDNGVLEIHIPRPEQPKPRRIAIETATEPSSDSERASSPGEVAVAA